MSASACLIEAAMDGVVGALEEQALAIADELHAGVGIFGVEVIELLAREDARGGDVVLHLHLVGGSEIGPELVDAPGAIAIEADAEVVTDELLIVELEFVAEEAVDAIDGEVLAPVVAPFGAVVALDGEDELADGLGELADPVVVLVGVFGRRG